MDINNIKRSVTYSEDIIKAFYECKGCERCDLAVDGEISELCLLLEQFKNDILDRIKRAIDNEERR